MFATRRVEQIWRAHVPFDVRPFFGKQRCCSTAEPPSGVAGVRRSAVGAEGLLGRYAHPSVPPTGSAPGKGLALDHLGKLQRQPHRQHLAVLRQPVHASSRKRCCSGSRADSSGAGRKPFPKTRPGTLRALHEVEQIDRALVVPLDPADLELLEGTADGRQKSSRTLGTTAWTRTPSHWLRASTNSVPAKSFRGCQPLSELIQDQQPLSRAPLTHQDQCSGGPRHQAARGRALAQAIQQHDLRVMAVESDV